MATNQMRREAAKRKLERQQQRRAEQAVRRKKVSVITAAAVAVVVVVGVVALTVTGGDDEPAEPTAAAPPTGTCFTLGGSPAKPVTAPNVTAPATTGTVGVTLTTNHGTIPLTLDRAKAPCTVESFLHLARAGYFDATPCHRLTALPSLSVLQCGDPTGAGSGGPGYTIKDEPPVDLAPAPAGRGTVIYPRGTLAMAKTDQPDSGGSQFFLVHADSTLPPDYTVFGTIGEPGLAVLDKIAAGGENSENGPGDGAPNQAVTIESAQVT